MDCNTGLHRFRHYSPNLGCGAFVRDTSTDLVRNYCLASTQIIVAKFGNDFESTGVESVAILPTNKTTPQAFAIGVASEQVMVERRKPITSLLGRAPY